MNGIVNRSEILDVQAKLYVIGFLLIYLKIDYLYMYLLEINFYSSV